MLKEFSDDTYEAKQKKLKMMLLLKTHVTKFETEVLAFSLKKYCLTWKKSTEEYKVQMLKKRIQEQS